jgi:hypothetical protein
MKASVLYCHTKKSHSISMIVQIRWLACAAISMSFQQQWEDVEEDSNTTTIPDHEAMSDSKAEHPAEFAAHGLNIISHNIEKLALDITAAVDPGPPPDGGCTDGFGEDGFFAEYAIIDYRNAIILPESMNLKESSSLFCAGITGKSTNLQLFDTQRLASWRT